MALSHAERTEADYSDLLAQSAVPTHLHAGLARYLVGHVRPGRFLLAVLENDLTEAVLRADEDCEAALAEIVRWLVCEAPPVSWGSSIRVRLWLERRDTA